MSIQSRLLQTVRISIGQSSTDVSLGFGGDAYGGYMGSDFVIKHNNKNSQDDYAMNDYERMTAQQGISSPSANNVFASTEEGYVDLNGQGVKEAWDLNGDERLQKNEADKWWLNGGGKIVNVNNAYIDWTGVQIPKGAAKGIDC